MDIRTLTYEEYLKINFTKKNKGFKNDKYLETHMEYYLRLTEREFNKLKTFLLDNKKFLYTKNNNEYRITLPAFTEELYTKQIRELNIYDLAYVVVYLGYKKIHEIIIFPYRNSACYTFDMHQKIKNMYKKYPKYFINMEFKIYVANK
jgi:hypothetical protein